MKFSIVIGTLASTAVAAPVLNAASAAKQQGDIAADTVNLLTRTMNEYRAYSDVEKRELDALADALLLARLTEPDGLQKRQSGGLPGSLGSILSGSLPNPPSSASSSETAGTSQFNEGTYYGQSGQSSYSGGAGGSVTGSGRRIGGIGGIVNPYGGVTGGLPKIGSEGSIFEAGSAQNTETASGASEGSSAFQSSDSLVEAR